MTIVKAGPAAWTWSEDVLAFAREAGVEGYLDALMAATRELFPGAEEIRVSVARDPEIKEFDGIRWEVFVPEDQVGDFLETTKRLGREFYRVCPPDPRCVYPFITHLRRAKP
jgi:hypothetical protein